MFVADFACRPSRSRMQRMMTDGSVCNELRRGVFIFFSYRIFHTDLRYSVSFDVGTFQLKIHSIDIRK